jgi:lipopolysaccharide assembly protein A
MRLFKTLIALMFVALGVVFGALNRQAVHIDLWQWTLEARLGLTLIGVLLLGALLGGLVVTAGVVWPLRRRLRQTGNAGSGPDLPVSTGTENP